MNKDITTSLFQNYFEKNLLDKITLDIPKCGKVIISLSKLYNALNNLEGNYKTDMKNIESIAIYGSVLYKHFPLEKRKISLGKKYIFWGEEQFYEKIMPRQIPKDLDLMIITTKPSNQEKIIRPNKINGSYGTYSDPKQTVVKTEQTYLDESYGWLSGVSEGTMDLHVAYRGIEQLKEGIGNGDSVAESIIKYGVPIFGKKKFNEIIKNISSLERGNLHEIKWDFNLNGKLIGEIL